MTNLEIAALILIIILASLVFASFVKKLVKKEKINTIDVALPFSVFVLGFLFVLALAFKQSIEAEEGQITNWVQIFLTLGLVLATGLTTLWAFRQAKANEKMAKEMEEERLMASRPVIIQKAVGKGLDTEPDVLRSDYFSHFEIYNAGNGPAIELTIAVVTEEKDSYIEARRETFMRAGDTPIEFHPFNISAVLEEKKTYYFACEYQGILSRVGKETWYQTWLPFKVDKASKEGEVYVTAGKLDFKEVTEKDRIDNLIRWSKPS